MQSVNTHYCLLPSMLEVESNDATSFYLMWPIVRRIDERRLKGDAFRGILGEALE